MAEEKKRKENSEYKRVVITTLITNKLEDNAKLPRVGMRRRMTDCDKTLDFFKNCM